MIRLLIYIVCLIPSISMACSVPPSSAFMPNYEVIESSSFIVVAKAINKRHSTGVFSIDNFEHQLEEALKGKLRKNTEPVEFEFLVEETLKGNREENIKLLGLDISKYKETSTDFDSHFSPKFWAGFEYNGVHWHDCGVYGAFEIGKSYLLIKSINPHIRAYEEINSVKDLWYKTVKILISKK